MEGYLKSVVQSLHDKREVHSERLYILPKPGAGAWN